MNRAHLILPNTEPDLTPFKHLPLFFLAGPIQGGGDWHYNMSNLLDEEIGSCLIVNPSRYRIGHPHYSRRLAGKEDYYERQTDWERHYLYLAAKGWSKGCVIFWLPKESIEKPRRDGNPYARDTYGELGEWRGRLMHDRSLRVTVGADEKFPGLSQIERNFHMAVDHYFSIFTSMDNVVDEVRNRAVLGRHPSWLRSR
jgi:hypothetical protein